MTNVVSLTSTKPAPISWVEKLFERMEALYGSKFLDMWRDANADLVKQLWSEEMGKLSADDLKRGYNALMSRDWPPSLPEFVKLCKPSVDPTVAYYEAVNGMQARERGETGKWSHPAIFWAAVQVSAFDLKNQSYSQIKARWEKALQDEMDKGQWVPVPEPLVALPEPGKSAMSREHAAKMVEELQASDTIKKADDNRVDHKAWAKRILERAKAANHGLSALQIRFAKEALAAKAV
jgi:hypothetical protein